MREDVRSDVGGRWVDPVERRLHDVENPAAERFCDPIALRSSADVDRAAAEPRAIAEQVKVGQPADRTALRPAASRPRTDEIQRLIQTGPDVGAALAASGSGTSGWPRARLPRATQRCRPVRNDMTIAGTQIVGPALFIRSDDSNLGYGNLGDLPEIGGILGYGTHRPGDSAD